MTISGLRPRRIAELTPENLAVLIEDMGGPGYYRSADLYRWYVGLTEEDDLEPISHRKFGGALKEMGFQSLVRSLEGKPVRCWNITGQRLAAIQPPATPSAAP
jgi:hypothetical protein